MTLPSLLSVDGINQQLCALSKSQPVPHRLAFNAAFDSTKWSKPWLFL